MEVRFYQEEDRREAAQSILRLYTGGVSREAPPVRNLDAVLELGDGFEFSFRGKRWEIPPVSFEDGARALALARWIDGITARPDSLTVENYRDRVREAVSLIHSVVRPKGRLRRIVYRLRGEKRSPFRTATDHELGVLIGFSWRRRTRSPDRRL